MSTSLNRRRLVQTAASLPLVGLGGAITRPVFAQGTPTGDELPPLDALRFFHPETLAFAAPFLLMQSSDTLNQYASSVEFDTWTTPDVLRTTLVAGESEVTAVPSYVGANLANRGIDVKMAAISVWGLLWVIGPDGTEADWEQLRGQTVLIPFPNDMPDLISQYLALSNGLTPGEDLEVQYFAQPPEVVSQLVAGNGTWAVLPEHVATMALMQSQQNDLGLGRVFDLQEEWGNATGLGTRIPQAGIVVPTWLAEERPALLGAILDEMQQAVETVNEAAPETVSLLAEATGMPEPVVADVIPRLNLEVVPAAEAQEDLERFYTELLTLSPDIIGGQLPDASFYLADPR